MSGLTFQEVLRRLSQFWEKQGCIIHQGYDLEMGAGTFNPATFLRCLGPEPYNAAYIEPCRRPSDGRYGENPNRLQHYFQYQVILKPSPDHIQQLYLQSLQEVGFDLKEHDIRFVHDDWEAPTLSAWGLGWEVWMDGMEVTQLTYFQTVGGLTLKPVTGEITYGIERLAMYLQGVDSIFDLQWNDTLTYGDLYHPGEVEWSFYNFEEAEVSMWQRHFDDYELEAKKMMRKKLPLPAYDFVMKASHAFNILDARGAISVTERTGYIARIRDLARKIAESYVKSREKLGFPLLQQKQEKSRASPDLPPSLYKPEQEEDDYLLEIGVEELPAAFVPIGMKGLKEGLTRLLEQESLGFSSISAYGTPRRLAVVVRDLQMKKPASIIKRRGPAVQKAFDSLGEVQKAGDGFFRSIGKEIATLKEAQEDPDLLIEEIKQVPYLFALIRQKEQSAAEILQKKLPCLIERIEFPKAMRWGDEEVSFARPIRWIVSLLGKTKLPFAFAHLVAGNTSSGHRQLMPGPFSIPSASVYLESLKERFVIADANERADLIAEQIEKLGKKAVSQEIVIPQVVHLTEYPQVLAGTFNQRFLRIPKEVLISEMVEHQKYFPVAKENGELDNAFLITADNTPSDMICKGNERVLSARLSDGAFLYEQGLKKPLQDFNEKLKNVVFQKKLGSVYEKVQRLVRHVDTLQKQLHLSTPELAARAALLSKADLASDMVFEFPDLQGTIGKYYALKQGDKKEVAEAIEEQWMPRKENGNLPRSDTGVLLSLADKIDNLIGCFAAGLKPTSSSDPHALRRQALGIIRMAIEKKISFNLSQIFAECARHFPQETIGNYEDLLSDLEAFFLSRLKSVFLDHGIDKDETEAALSQGISDLYDAYCKVHALHQFRQTSQFSLLFEVYKRARGQLEGYGTLLFSSDLLKEKAEAALHKVLDETHPKLMESIDKRDYTRAYALIAKVQPALANLFDQVQILVDNEDLRNNRIALLQRVFTLFSLLLDFGKIIRR